jgi:protein-tyrosine phosphatase
MTRTVFVVCTANICRSPMGEGLLARELLAGGSSTVVMSAGTHAVDAPVAEEAVAAVAGLGADIAGHRAHLLSRGDLDAAAIVLVMERAHVAHVVATDASAFGRTFCLREIVARIEARGARRANESFDEWVARMHRGRRAADVLRGGTELDVADPIGQDRDAFDRCARDLDELTRVVAPEVA